MRKFWAGLRKGFGLRTTWIGTPGGSIYQGPTAQRRRFKNNIPPEFVPWVRDEIKDWLKKGCIIPWSKERFGAEEPELILPLLVEESKPRLIYDGRWLNLFFETRRFSLDPVSRTAALAWQGCYMASIDHKSAYHHCALNVESFKWFGFEMDGVTYVFTTLCFGWVLAPYIYQSLSDALLAGFARRLLEQVGLLTYLDDSWLTGSHRARGLGPLAEFHSCNQAVFVFGSVLFYAGIFINVGKSILRPVQILRYLGINVDSLRCRFWVPEDRVQKLVSQIQRILEAGWVLFGELEQVIGRCVSMTTAVNCAMLYTREQYRAVLPFLAWRGKSFAYRTGRLPMLDGTLPRGESEGKVRASKDVAAGVRIVNELREELSMWLMLSTLAGRGLYGRFVTPLGGTRTRPDGAERGSCPPCLYRSR